ncbi:hypothetical protein DL98DRAFT_608749 [Cadophora sp. DSE1049]|nr:hypothetical protein DL98DRAFT_608749 [Cadophora sp. DSE1049]
MNITVTGNSHIELPFMMFKQLLEYAKAFEYLDEFKARMAGQPDEFNPVCDEDEFNHPPIGINPYIDFRVMHPVKQALRRAKGTAARNDVMDFKSHRATVFNYFERQYQRIAARFTTLRAIINREKRAGGVFDPLQPFQRLSPSGDDAMLHKMMQANVLLVNYKDSFERECPVKISANMELCKTKLDSVKSGLPREIMLRRIDPHIAKEAYRVIVRDFTILCDHLDEQFSEIETGREDLLKFDIPGTNASLDVVYHINVTPRAAPGPVDWTQNSP